MTGPDMSHPGDEMVDADPSDRLTVGSRVVVRHRLPEGAEAGATDVIGRLALRTDEVLLVDTRNGRVTVPRRDVLAAKPIPPRATRPGPAHLRVSIEDLSVVTAHGWVAVEQEGLGAWLLRSAPGYTGRANSVLVVGDPSLPVEEAIDYCERWYAERDQRAMFQVSGETGFVVADHAVGQALLRRGYAVGGGRNDWDRVLVMTGPSSGIPPLTEQSVPVAADAHLSPEWLSALGEQRTVVPGVTESVLTGSERQLFLSIRDEGSRRIVALARIAVHPGWAGVFGLWVHPDHRRRGLARTIMSAVGTVAREQHLPAIYLQVSADNDPAISFYEALGFTVHHEYTYLVQPPA
ncbi:GNAT family N-acetyltransferase [Intrasporangium sp.]|uniref:GNAT family N-acetyltransferase n=1 Tax=Intrasporangium sp. TaxID=1925024 RepID=UPI00293B50D3|nr:GNAT family N-acetyltransferase [Intrasporangium sp.]MDV3221405.1 GNAT family N-acetyltransferase [Intrasporangium sp.]